MPSRVSRASVSALLPPSSLAASARHSSSVLGGNSAITRSLRSAQKSGEDYTARRREASIEGARCGRFGLGGDRGKAIRPAERVLRREIFFRRACYLQEKN